MDTSWKSSPLHFFGFLALVGLLVAWDDNIVSDWGVFIVVLYLCFILYFIVFKKIQNAPPRWRRPVAGDGKQDDAAA